MSIRENIAHINQLKAEAAQRSGRSGEDVLLVAVTKLHDVDEINEAIDCGITDIGENKVQEIMDKYEHVKPVRWHLIGHLQTNKVKYIIDKVDMIQSVDSLRLAAVIDEHCAKAGKVMDVLVQLNMGEEENKFGIPPKETAEFLRKISSYRNICVRGLMGVVPHSDNTELTKKYFLQLYNIFLARGRQRRCPRSMTVRLY